MRIQQILTEVPFMVSQKDYGAVKGEAVRALEIASSKPNAYRTEYEEGNIRIAVGDRNELILFAGDRAVGVMHLTPDRIGKQLGKTVWQVTNVYVLPKSRDKKFGLMLYKHILHHRKEAFAASAAMTPSSRRIYDSLLRDPSVDVYALRAVDRYEDEYEKLELHIGPDGITTGDPKMDRNVTFVMDAK